MNKTDSNTAIVLLNLGGPDSLDAVEPFLFNLFNDPDIISIPPGFLLQKPLAGVISHRRAPIVRKRYEMIGGKSPINEWTNKQATALEQELQSYGNYKVFVGMRYWHPLIEDVILQIAQSQFDRVILLPLYPQYSLTTTGSSFREWDRACNKLKCNHLNVRYIHGYADWQPYIDAIEEKIREGLNQFPEKNRDSVQFLFSCHGIPQSLIKKGDPYVTQILTTVNRVMQRFYGISHHISYQSKVGKIKWLEPSTIDKVKELGSSGIKNLLAIPISFVSDHLETLEELNIFIREIAQRSGIINFIVMPALNDSPAFIRALAKLVREEVLLLNCS